MSSGRLRRRRCLGPALLLTSMWMLAGCVNLDDVAGLTELAGRAERTLPRISDDIVGTCTRRNAYLEDTPKDERQPTDAAVDCAPYKDVSEHLAKDQKVLTDYFEALGKLASNTPLSYEKTIDTDIKVIPKLSGLAADTITASSAAESIAQALGDAATHAYRQRQVNGLIQANDAAVQELVAALKRVMATDYPILLGDEQNYMDAYYQGPMAAPKGERLALILVQRRYEEDRSLLSSRRRAVPAYAKVMDDFSTLHAKLKLEADAKASLKQIATIVGPAASSLGEAIGTLESRTK